MWRMFFSCRWLNSSPRCPLIRRRLRRSYFDSAFQWARDRISRAGEECNSAASSDMHLLVMMIVYPIHLRFFGDCFEWLSLACRFASVSFWAQPLFKSAAVWLRSRPHGQLVAVQLLHVFLQLVACFCRQKKWLHRRVAESWTCSTFYNLLLAADDNRWQCQHVFIIFVHLVVLLAVQDDHVITIDECS